MFKLPIIPRSLLILLACWIPGAGLFADVITVGDDPGCDFAELQDAIDAAWDGGFIRVNSGWHGRAVGYNIHQKSLTVTGGYVKCWGPRIGITTLYSEGESHALSIRSLDKRAQVRLVNLEISGARPEAPEKRVTAGVSITGDVDVEMDRVRVHHGSAANGAGVTLYALEVGISERRPTLSLIDSHLSSNRASNGGGGLSCRRANVAITNTTFFANGASAGAGALFSDCEVAVDGGAGPLRLISNSADRVGGGLMLTDSRLTATAGENGRPSVVAEGNWAGLRGGAVHVAANSRFEVDGLRFEDNTAVWYGGALHATESTVRLGQGLGSCWTSAGCQILEGNLAGQQGGALYLVDTFAAVDQVRARDNLGLLGGGSFASVLADSNATFRNLVATKHRGKTLIDAAGADQLRITSSTLFHNEMAGSVLSVPGTEHTIVSQSIFAFNGSPYVDGGDALFFCSFLDGLFPDPPFVSEIRYGDPRFVSDDDFHLAYDSPAAEQCDGHTARADVDADFEARPSRGRSEPGADELD